MNRVNVFAIRRCINEGYGLIRIFNEKIRISPTKLWRVCGRLTTTRWDVVRVRQDYVQGVRRLPGSRRTTIHGGGGATENFETYNVSTLLKDKHGQELEEELKENNMKWDVIARIKLESFKTPKWPATVPL